MENTKRCYDCKLDLPISKYSFKNKVKGKLSSRCKDCHNTYNREVHYASHREEYIIRSKIQKKKRIKVLERLKLMKGCSVCGYKKCPRALHFHHTSDKDFVISQNTLINRKKLLDEIKKCVVLCANCHYELHDKENSQS